MKIVTFWKVDIAVEKLLKSQYSEGDVIPHEWIRGALEVTPQGLAENEFLLLERVEELKTTLLREHGILLSNVRSMGYRIVPSAEHALHAAMTCSGYIRKGLRKANDILAHTRTEQLSAHSRKQHTDTSIRMAALEGLISKGKRDIFKAFDESKNKEISQK